MKKLMIMFAAVAVTGIVNAASTVWGSGMLKVAKDANGGWGSDYIGTVGGYSVDMKVVKIDLATYNVIMGLTGDDGAWTQAQIFDAYKDTSTSLTGQNKNPSTGAFINAVTITENPSDSGIEYGVVIATYTHHDASTGKDIDMYMATAAATTYNGATSKGNAPNLMSTVGARPTDGGWQTVPEPTSGLLLLLGVAGLALKRKRA